ncbi:MAG TPA: serine hydrolase [Planctomycetota bacterium]|nr:serine hydrolase [Planctomycetota bacterium]
MRPVVVAAVLTSLPPLARCQTAPSPELAEVAAAYAAKVAASALFVSGRTLESVRAEELAPTRPIEVIVAPLLRFDVDAAGRTVTCRVGQAKATAVATTNLGCTLVRPDVAAHVLRERTAPAPAVALPDPAAVDWPLGDRLPADPPAGVDHAALAAAVDAAFAEMGAGPRVGTRAIVVVHKGRLVLERYAKGYDASMPLPGWSMTKTIVNALVGIRVAQGKLDLDAALRVPEWQQTGDRLPLHLADLLTMSAGLPWNEDEADADSDLLRMLFRSSDHAGVYASRPAATARGREYHYASGSTNLVCRVLRGTFASDRDYWAFPRTALFGPLAMRSALVETDPSGTFVGSSYGFATARDWARLGMLYAHDGVFAGQRVLPEGWVARSSRPAPASGGRFGSHIWLNADPDGDGPRARMWPDLPADLLHMDGFEGQYCVVFPGADLVVVRLGCTKNGGFGLHGLLRDVLRACSG